MAKQLVNPIERHVEKGIVGICALLLVGAIARFVVTTPNQVDLGGQPVTPSTIDSRLAEKALSIQQRIQNAPVQVELPDPLLPEFEKSLSPVEKASWRRAVAFNPEVPMVDRPGAVVGQAKLVEVLPFPKPKIAFGRATLAMSTPDGQSFYVPSNWVTVSSIFDVKQQTEKQRLAYGATRADVVFGPIEVQRRAQRPDGSWSDEDWSTLPPWPSRGLREIPTITFVDDRGKPNVLPEVRRRLDQFINDLMEPATQLRLLRPLIPETVNGDRWRFPVITNYRDVLMQDDEYLYPNEPPAPSPVDRYDLDVVGPAREVTRETPAQMHTRLLKEAEDLIERARKTNSVDDAILAYNRAKSVERDTDASAADKARAKRIADRAELAEADIARLLRMNPGLAGVGGEADRPKREKLPMQQVWVVDGRPDSVISGNTYQYRMRANVINRLIADPIRFANPEDAAVVFVPGPWSEPADPLFVPPSVEFYITGEDARREDISVEVFQWFDGVWAKSRRFRFAVGDAVAGESRHPIPSWTNPGNVENAMVPFQADAMLIDLDFSRPIRERRSGGRGTAGVRFGAASNACAAVYVDASGRLMQKLSAVEKDHPGRRAVTGRVWTPR